MSALQFQFFLVYLKLPTGNLKKLQNELNAGMMTDYEPCPWRSDPMLA